MALGASKAEHVALLFLVHVQLCAVGKRTGLNDYRVVIDSVRGRGDDTTVCAPMIFSGQKQKFVHWFCDVANQKLLKGGLGLGLQLRH
jgi:hypothetical protein